MTDQTLTWQFPPAATIPRTGEIIARFGDGRIRVIDASTLRPRERDEITAFATWSIPDAAVSNAREQIAPSPHDPGEPVSVETLTDGTFAVKAQTSGMRGPVRRTRAHAVEDWNKLPR